ncbi:nucleotidyltransferase domain-containing protein [Candidatus Pacearchaeota archaeon]|nr:nucleotidyltransferase domain-containing protein [Candidatus Pacearchaeota archaeon]
MENSIIKPIIRVGNSAGVVLPLEWYGGKARIELIQKPLNIKADILDILNDYMENILGVYLTGSYARKEQTNDSDVDVLVVTSDINKKINKGKYEILMISLDELKKARDIVIPIIPMLKEAVPIINKKLLDELLDFNIKKENLKWHLETTKSSLKMIRTILNIEEDKVGGNVIYPLILRLREAYIIDCLLKNRKYRKKDFLEMLKRRGIYELYKGYELEKRSKKAKLVDRKKAKVVYQLILSYLNDYGKKEDKKIN